MSLDKDLKYCKQQLDLQEDKVRKAQGAIDKIQYQIDMFDVAIREIRKQQQEKRNSLKEAQDRYSIAKYEYNRQHLHYKQLEQHKNMLKNQHKATSC